MISGVSLAAMLMGATVPGAPAATGAAVPEGATLDFFALVEQGMETAAGAIRPQSFRVSEAAAFTPVFAAPEETTAEEDASGGEEPRPEEDESAPPALFFATPPPPAPPDPLPLSAAPALSSISSAAPEQLESAPAPPEVARAERGFALEERPAQAEGFHDAASAREPAAEVAAAPFTVPLEPARPAGGDLSFAARIQERVETPPDLSEPRPAAPEPDARTGAPAPEIGKPAMQREAGSAVRMPETEAPAIARHAPQLASVHAAKPAQAAAMETPRIEAAGQNEKTAAPAEPVAPRTVRAGVEPSRVPADEAAGPAPLQRIEPAAKPDTGESHEHSADRNERRSAMRDPEPAAARRETEPAAARRETEPAAARREIEPAAAKHDQAALPQAAPVTHAATARTAAEPRSVPEHAAEPAQAARVASPQEPEHTEKTGAAHEITLNLARDRDRAVEVRVVERAGEVRVAVRTPDRELTQALRENLGDLTRTLEDRGFRSETWRPEAAAAAFSDARRDNGAGGSSAGDPREAWSGQPGAGQHGEGRRRHHPQQPAWVEELEQQAGGEPASPFRSFLK